MTLSLGNLQYKYQKRIPHTQSLLLNYLVKYWVAQITSRTFAYVTQQCSRNESAEMQTSSNMSKNSRLKNFRISRASNKIMFALHENVTVIIIDVKNVFQDFYFKIKKTRFLRFFLFS